jgi:hypothetical protein
MVCTSNVVLLLIETVPIRAEVEERLNFDKIALNHDVPVRPLGRGSHATGSYLLKTLQHT